PTGQPVAFPRRKEFRSIWQNTSSKSTNVTSFLCATENTEITEDLDVGLRSNSLVFVHSLCTLGRPLRRFVIVRCRGNSLNNELLHEIGTSCESLCAHL